MPTLRCCRCRYWRSRGRGRATTRTIHPMIAIAPFPASAARRLARALRTLVKFLLACCCACGAADGTAAGVQDFEEGAKTLVSGCSWRGAPTDEYEPHDPT